MFCIGSKEPQSGAIFVEERTPINLAPLFEIQMLWLSCWKQGIKNKE